VQEPTPLQEVAAKPTPALPSLPGLPEYYTVVPVSNGNEPPGGPAGGPGEYQVIFVLTRFEGQFSELQVNLPPTELGDSYIKLATPAPAVSTNHQEDGRRIDFTFHLNERGFVGRAISAPFVAQNFADAETAAYRSLAPLLSAWSVLLDVPIRIFRTHIEELKTHSRCVMHLVPFPEITFQPAAGGHLDEHFRFYASLYREGLNSNSPPYQYLCFYKIAEGIRLRRERVDREALEAGRVPKREPERLPATYTEAPSWLNALFAVARQWEDFSLRATIPEEVLGKKINAVLDSTLEDLRDDIAHALTQAGEFRMSADTALHSAEIQKWLPLLRCIARLLLKVEFPNSFVLHG